MSDCEVRENSQQANKAWGRTSREGKPSSKCKVVAGRWTSLGQSDSCVSFAMGMEIGLPKRVAGIQELHVVAS